MVKQPRSMTTNPVLITAIIALLSSFYSLGFAWNNAGHMLSGSIAYQILRAESPDTIAAVKVILEKHPWNHSRWKEQLNKLPEPQRDELLFMLAARWCR